MFINPAPKSDYYDSGDLTQMEEIRTLRAITRQQADRIASLVAENTQIKETLEPALQKVRNELMFASPGFIHRTIIIVDKAIGCGD